MEMLKRRVLRYNVRNNIQGINWNLCSKEYLKEKLDEIGAKDLP